MFRKALLCALIALPFAGICQKNKKAKKTAVATVPAPGKVDYKQLGSPMPPLRIVTEQNKSITDAMVKNDANLIVMMFNPTCGHCEDMTRAIEQNIFLFKKTNVVLVAAAGMHPHLEYFQKNVKAAEYPSLMIGVDSTNFIDNSFNYSGLPQVNIYDHSRKLIKTYSGITTIDSIKAYIE